MKINGVAYRTIWLADDGTVEIIDQTRLPHRFETVKLIDSDEVAHAICTMQVRGAPLIGATAAYGVALGMCEDASDDGLDAVLAKLAATRPTAVNLRWALAEMDRAVRPLAPEQRAASRLRQGRRDLRRGCGDQPPHRRKRAALHPPARRAQERRAGECADPLQCRLAGLRRLGHGAVADLPGA